MKVPIDVEGKKPAEQEPEVVEAEVIEPESEDGAAAEQDPEAEERARVEAAIRAGEAAAEEDFKADAEKIRVERDELQQQLDGVADEIAAAKKEAADATERMARLQADWENYRRRTAQERLAEKERAAEKLVLSLLPVLDDMERACDHAGKTAADDEALLQFVSGVSAIHDKMYGVLNREGVEEINPVGEAFDPALHEAIGRVEDGEAFDESVAQVFQKGYRMGSKVIRSAMVTVSCGGPKRPEPEVESEPAAQAEQDAQDAE